MTYLIADLVRGRAIIKRLNDFRTKHMNLIIQKLKLSRGMNVARKGNIPGWSTESQADWVNKNTWCPGHWVGEERID